MSTDEPADAALLAASTFLAPVYSREAKEGAPSLSLLEHLAGPSASATLDENALQSHVIVRALGLLKGIQDGLRKQDIEPFTKAESRRSAADYLYEPSHRRTVSGLLDLITLEGVYPCLSTGVGIPLERRIKSILPAGAVPIPSGPSGPAATPPSNLIVLEMAVDCLADIARDGRKGLAPILRERSLADLVAASGELAYGPSIEGRHRMKYQTLLKTLIDQTSTPELLPALTVLIHPATPAWLRSSLSAFLSVLPLRENGVRQVIEFIASTTSPSLPYQGQEGDEFSASSAAQGPPLSLEALAQASRLLASVPSFQSPDVYFKELSPQLFNLIDGRAGPEMSTAAAFVVGSGVLGKKAFGAPGASGWMAFAAPVLNKINPSIQFRATRPESSSRSGDGAEILVDESELDLALRRLSTLVFSHPNPGLTRRLLRPLLKPLWAIATIGRLAANKSIRELGLSLLQTYFKVSTDTDRISLLTEDLLYDGEPSSGTDKGWQYVLTDADRMTIQKRGQINSTNANIERMGEVGARVDYFVQLLKAGIVSDEQIGRIFLATTRLWLSSAQKPPAKHSRVGADDDEDQVGDALRLLVNAKLVQSMLEHLKDRLGHSSGQILQLVKQILDGFVAEQEVERRRIRNLKSPTLSGLQHIVNVENKVESSPEISHESRNYTTSERAELITIALSLLSSVMSSMDLAVANQDQAVLSFIKPSLLYISKTSVLPVDTTTTALNLANLVDFLASSPHDPTEGKISQPDRLLEDRKAHSLALNYLADPIPPVRAQGFSLITDLIKASSPIIDIPATSSLLISLLQDSDEFIYLNAIKALSSLADKHSRTVTRLMVERYVDRSEELSLDQRLRLGEAILQMIQRLGDVLSGDAAQLVGEACLDLAGRRGKRPKGAEEKLRKTRLRQGRSQEAREAWGGELPQIGDEEPADQEAELLARIVEGWEGKDGEEDVRIRTSALTLFGAAIEINIAGLGSQLVSSAVDLALSVLTLETNEERSILRRSAVLLILNLIEALEQAREENRNLGFGLAGENLQDVVRVLRYVEATDEDSVVREHAATVATQLELWRYKNNLGFVPGRHHVGTDLETQDKPLSRLPTLPREKINRPKIEEID